MDTTQQKIQELETQIARLKSDMESLSQNFYKNNFSAHQDFNKASSFNTSLKPPVFSTLPTCQVGEICSIAGKLYICSATDTWTIVGTQS